MLFCPALLACRRFQFVTKFPCLAVIIGKNNEPPRRGNNQRAHKVHLLQDLKRLAFSKPDLTDMADPANRLYSVTVHGQAHIADTDVEHYGGGWQKESLSLFEHQFAGIQLCPAIVDALAVWAKNYVAFKVRTGSKVGVLPK